MQFSQNIAQYMLPNADRHPLLTLERALSIIAFILGSLVGALGGRRWGDRNRAWLMATSFIQSLTLFGAAGILLSRPEEEPPSFHYWPGTIVLVGFISFHALQASRELMTIIAFNITGSILNGNAVHCSAEARLACFCYGES